MHVLHEVYVIYDRGVFSGEGDVDGGDLVRFGTLGTPTQAAEGGENNAGDTESRDNRHLLTLPGKYQAR